MTPQEVIRLLSFLTLISNTLVLTFVAVYLLRSTKIVKKLWASLFKYLSSRSTFFAFLVALTAMTGSLYFSEIALFEPCKLCWFQRILMYPQVFILGSSIYYKIKDIWKVELPLVVIGLLLSGYHYYLQLNPNPLASCGTVGFSVSCSEKFLTYFGYITIPWMSFSAFVMILILMIINKHVGKK